MYKQHFKNNSTILHNLSMVVLRLLSNKIPDRILQRQCQK